MHIPPDVIFLLDGATGTELDRRGVDTSLPLWSARAITDAPGVLKDIHAAYLKAGADALLSNTFRTHERSLAKAGIGEQAQALTQEAVSIACAARDEVNPNALIYGSVAPLEDCYRPDLAPDARECRAEHGQIIRHLIDAGVDLVLIETMCSAREALAAAEAAEELSQGKWAISFCLASDGEPGVLLDGTPLEELLPQLTGAEFVGVNCVAAPVLAGQVKHLRSVLPPEMAIAAYGNVGHVDHERGWVNTDAIDPERYALLALDWIKAGARIIGGCCGTTPATIQSIKKKLPSSYTAD